MLLEKRRAFPLKQRQRADQIIQKKAWKLCQTVERIGIYVSLPEEVDTQQLICRMLSAGKKVYVPRCQQKTLTFHQIRSLEELRPSRFHLLEPVNEPSSFHDIQLIFVPVVGFDEDYNRIGYGHGYYDSVLNQIHAEKIGLAYRFQKVKVLPKEIHDVPLDNVLTD